MSESLIKRMRKAREQVVDVAGFRFFVRRPTDWDALQLQRKGATLFDVARDFVTGWDNVKESDLIKSGGSDDVVFDVDLWREWVADRPDFWQPINDAIVESYAAHQEKTRTASKN